jgi:hypothetical protein
MGTKFYALLLVVFTGLQGAFWWNTGAIRPATDVVPTPPGKAALQALSLGDSESYFRFRTMQLQNFGDNFGRSVSLRFYDYSRLYQWLTLLDTLNSRSNMLPSMATYYFSQTQNPTDIYYMVSYLYAHSKRDVPRKWWWLMQCIYLSLYRVNDIDLAMKVAKPMIDPAVPAWAQSMVAVVHERRGEMHDALRIMEEIEANAKDITEEDLRFMRYFVEERIQKLEAAEGKKK